MNENFIERFSVLEADEEEVRAADPDSRTARSRVTARLRCVRYTLGRRHDRPMLSGRRRVWSLASCAASKLVAECFGPAFVRPAFVRDTLYTSPEHVSSTKK